MTFIGEVNFIGTFTVLAVRVRWCFDVDAHLNELQVCPVPAEARLLFFFLLPLQLVYLQLKDITAIYIRWMNWQYEDVFVGVYT